MKHLSLVLLFAATVGVNATTIPAGYYSTCQGTKDSVLKTSLSLIVRKGDRYHYGPNDTYHQNRVATCDTVVYGVLYHTGDVYHKSGSPKHVTWQAFPYTDRQTDGSIWDMYSNTHRLFPVTNGESACNVQIEHCLPKSWWGVTGTAAPDPEEDHAYCDLFNLSPSSNAANNNKSNYPPGFVTKADKFNNGSFKMDKTESCQYGKFPCFEPADCYKGDFARTYFYMVTAYEYYTWKGGTSSSQAIVDSVMDNSTYLEFRPWLIDILLQWHRSDPVSQKEIDRQNLIFSLQSNRNPYIDYPELVEYIWGNKKGQTVDFSQLTCTQDASYRPQPEQTAFEAYPATDIQDNSFVASWNGFFAGPYLLEVYKKRSIQGSNDTLFNYPSLGLSEIKLIPNCSYNDKVKSAGTQSITMGKSSGAGSDGYIQFKNLQLTEAATLFFRASTVGSVGSTARIDIFLNDHVEADTSITDLMDDEIMYQYPLPAGTDSIRLLSVGEDTKKRASMQALYIIRGNMREVLDTVVTQTVTWPTANYGDTVSYTVQLPQDAGNTLYYRVSTPNGWITNEVSVYPTSLSTTRPSDLPLNKVMKNGQLIIYRNGTAYSVLGTIIR